MKKTMFRWLIALAIVIPCMMLTAFATERTVIDSGYCGGEGDGTNLTWTLYEDGEMLIEGTGAMANGAPWEWLRDGITAVTIGDGVTTIGNYAFAECWGLTTVTLGNGLQRIGEFAFGVTSLTEVMIPAGVTDIGVGAFSGSLYLMLAVAPENQNYCTVDGALLAKDMSRLLAYSTGRTDTTYTIPDSVTTVDWHAFFNAMNLKEVTIPAGVTDLGEAIFYNCTLKKIHLAEENTAFTMVDGALYTADMKRLAAYEGGNSRGSLHIPEGVETIDSGAFRFAALTSLCLPDSVGAWSEKFCYMSSLRSVVLGSGMEWIEDGDFNGTSKLKDIFYVGTEAEWNEIFYGDAPDATIHFVTREQLRTLTAEDGVALSAHCAPVGAEVSVLRADAPVGYRVADILLDGQPVEGRTFAVTGNHAVAVQFEAYGDFNPERSPVTRRSLAVWWTEHFVAPDVQPTGEWQFLDVPETDKDFRAIMLSAEMGIFAGNSNGEFVPEGTVTRAQLAAILSKTIYGPWVNADTFKGEGKYIDTAYFEGGWAEGYINMATQLGVMEGYSDGTFRPGIPAAEEDIILTAAPLAKLVVHRMTVSTDGVDVDKAWGKVGETVTVTATPDEGYKVAAIYVDGVAIKGNTFTITGDHVITAKFEAKAQSGTFGYFSLKVVNTIVVDGQKVDICRWVWTPAE